MIRHQTGRVLLLGGVSGSGKSTVAAEIGRRNRLPWMQVDDLRLALQRSRAKLPEGNEALYFFADIETRPMIWQQPAEVLRDALIGVGKAMSPAIEAVIQNHVDQGDAIIIEGDGIVPALVDRPLVRERVEHGSVRMVFLVEPDEEVLYENMLARARGIATLAEHELRTEAKAKWLFGQWITEHAALRELPVVTSRPWQSLVDRIDAATGDVFSR